MITQNLQNNQITQQFVSLPDPTIKDLKLETLKIDINKLSKVLTENPFKEMLKQQGKYMFERTQPFQDWMNIQKNMELIFYDKRNLSRPGTTCDGEDEFGNQIKNGVNFASADYMGLASHEDAIKAVTDVANEYGVGSGGSPLAFGISKYFLQLRQEIADYMGMTGCIIFSTGWMAGYGAIRGLVREYDHIVMDKLSHNCLVEGARVSTKNIHVVQHLSLKAHEEKIKNLREKYPDSGIFVITEGLFSMDADTIDLNALQQICKKYTAYMMIDAAHDFGCMGYNGRGTWELQGLKDLDNVIISATGSKSLSTNMGFVCCNNPAVIQYLQVYSTPYMFCNAISPVQCAQALANLRTLKSLNGINRRQDLQDKAIYLKAQFAKKGYKTIGQPSPIIPLFVGNEFVSRLVTRLMLNAGCFMNCIEFPVVSRDQARFRICINPNHSYEQLDYLVKLFDLALNVSCEIIGGYLGEDKIIQFKEMAKCVHQQPKL